ncbi:hypothetical protein DA803_01600 [[Mycoplasma] phocae]|uniref:Uncharacterized protein n=1 Tax=[Mycoplasma] phocae TaxID=142651 RepID=A0A2Z5IQ64_9BACT|nr:hypothetical protein [[Mycoplasma] phocae]AXE60780.1 hypothetical protein DA803_01600 [[Mycoplasma] phocae]
MKKKISIILGTLSLAAISGIGVISAVAWWSNKLNKVILDNYLEIAKQATQARHLTIDEAIRQIQEISMPKGVSKVLVSNVDNKIELKFEVSRGHALVDDITLPFTPIKKVNIDEFSSKVKNLVEYKFKLIDNTKKEIHKLVTPEGVASFEVITNNHEITIFFKSKPGYMEISNLVFTFLPIQEANITEFENKVKGIVDRKYRTVNDAINEIKKIGLPTGIKAIKSTASNNKINITFEMDFGYVQIENKTYDFSSIKDVNITEFENKVKGIVDRKYRTVNDAINEIKKIGLPTGIKAIKSTASNNKINITFEMDFGYVQIENKTYDFSSIKDVNITEFENKVKGIVDRKYRTVNDAINEIKKIGLPTGIKAIKSTASNNKINITFEMDFGYVQIENKTYDFSSIKDVNITEFENKVKGIVDRKYRTVNDAINEIKKIGLPTGIKAIKSTASNNKINITFEMDFGYVQIENKTYDFSSIKDVNITEFENKVKQILNRKHKTIYPAITEIKRLILPVGIKSIDVRTSNSKINITFKMDIDYAQIENKTYDFSPIQEVDLSNFRTNVTKLAKNECYSIEEYNRKVKELTLPVGVKEIKVNISKDERNVEFHVIFQDGYTGIEKFNVNLEIAWSI